MMEFSVSYPGNLEDTSTVGVRASDLAVGTDPIVRMRKSLLRRKDGNQRRQAIDGETLSIWEREVLARKQEVVSYLVIADHRLHSIVTYVNS